MKMMLADAVDKRFRRLPITAGLMALITIFGWLPPAPAADSRIDLTRDGKPAATIVIAREADRAARLAALELQYHLGKITGAMLPIEEVASEERQGGGSVGTRILVGESAATRALGLRCADFKPQEYLIRFATNAIVLIGRDRPERSAVNYVTGQGFPGIFDEQGTLYATYDFLERFCGVRWYLPTDLGIVFEPRSNLTVVGAEVRRSPAMKSRDVPMDYRYPADLCGDTMKTDPPGGNLPDRDHLLWMCRSRMGGMRLKANHSLYGYYGRFLKTHPEWFAKGYEDLKQPPQMCYTSTGLLAQVVRDARDYFDGKATNEMVAAGDYFAIVPMDNRGWCKCADCQARLLSKAAKGVYSAGNAASDYILGFVNRVAREVRKTHPDKRIVTLAYSNYMYPPEDGKMEPNVAVVLCLDTRHWCGEASRNNEQAVLKAWRNIGVPIALWMYYCYPALDAVQGNYRCFPAFFAHQIPAQNKLFIESGVFGMQYEPSYLFGSRQSALLDQLEFYITWKLADDPTLDGKALIDEFFSKYYGPAAEPMRRFYEKAEQIWWNSTNLPANVKGAELAWGHLGTPERMKELGGYMDRAVKAATNEPYRARVALFEKGIWQYMQKGAQEYLRTASVPLSAVEAPRIPSPAGSDPRKLDWDKGGALTGWRKLNGAPTAKRLEGRLLHDGTNLYIRLVDMTAPGALVERQGIWDSDEYELFFAGQRGRPYRQIGVDFKGRFECYRWGEESGNVWNSGAVILTDMETPDRWTLYVTLPLNKLLPDGEPAAKPFFMNVVRGQGLDDAVADAAAWNATLGGFHAPARMGQVTLK